MSDVWSLFIDRINRFNKNLIKLFIRLFNYVYIGCIWRNLVQKILGFHSLNGSYTPHCNRESFLIT